SAAGLTIGARYPHVEVRDTITYLSIRDAPDELRQARGLCRPFATPIPAQSPLGTQMFLTCVASNRNSVPWPWSWSVQSRGGRLRIQVRLRLPAEARSTIAAPSAEPAYHTASTSSCSASTRARAPRSPVTLFTTPAGTSEVSST